jgi:hypothetical protein
MPPRHDALAGDAAATIAFDLRVDLIVTASWPVDDISMTSPFMVCAQASFVEFFETQVRTDRDGAFSRRIMAAGGDGRYFLVVERSHSYAIRHLYLRTQARSTRTTAAASCAKSRRRSRPTPTAGEIDRITMVHPPRYDVMLLLCPHPDRDDELFAVITHPRHHLMIDDLTAAPTAASRDSAGAHNRDSANSPPKDGAAADNNDGLGDGDGSSSGFGLAKVR